MNRASTNGGHAHTVRVDDFVAQMDRSDRAKFAEACRRQDMAELEREAIARRIKQAREDAGLSQPEISEVLGIHRRTYQNYEADVDPRTPWGLMNQIAMVTGKTTEWLIHGEKATPELFAKVSSVDQVEDVRTEFRRDVGEIKTSLATIEADRTDLQAQIAAQNANLATQTQVLERIEASLANLPAFTTALSGLLERLEAAGLLQRRAGGER
jgi:transcriptional regulator with XRE-family HTH domain